jgi:hypothetical protein
MARVLIADDNKDAADTLALLFELKGHRSKWPIAAVPR